MYQPASTLLQHQRCLHKGLSARHHSVGRQGHTVVTLSRGNSVTHPRDGPGSCVPPGVRQVHLPRHASWRAMQSIGQGRPHHHLPCRALVTHVVLQTSISRTAMQRLYPTPPPAMQSTLSCVTLQTQVGAQQWRPQQ